MFTLQKAMQQGQRGQGLIEYVLVITFVSLVTFGTVSAVGGGVSDVYQNVICALGEGGEECGCDYETVTSGPSFTCTGGVLAVEAGTSCDSTAMSVLIENEDDSVTEVGMTYDADTGTWVVAHSDSDLCDRINGSDPVQMWLISRHADNDTVNSFGFGTGSDDSGDDTGTGDDTGNR